MIRRRTFLATTAAGLALAPAAIAQSPTGSNDTSRQLNAFLDAEYEAELQMNPEQLTNQGRKEQYDRLTDRSEAAADRQLAWRRDSVRRMKARFDPAKLDEEGRTSFEMWSLELERAEEAATFRRHRYIFGRNGPHTGIPNFMINFHRVDTPADMEAYITRVGLIGAALDQTLERAKLAAGDGIRMPRFAYDQTRDEIGRFLTGAPFTAGKDSALLGDARTKIGALKTSGKIDQAQADRLLAQVQAAMTSKMKPAYDRISAWVDADEAKASEEAKGAWSLPNGDKYYASQLYLQTTTRMSAEEIHQLGLSEVARIRREMEAIREKVGFKGTLADFFVFMRTDRRFYLPNTDAGAQEYIRRADQYLTGMKAALPRYFGILPKADLVVRRVEPFREEPGGAQHYSRGTADGSRPGVYYAHLSDMDAMPTYQLENIAYHEGVPGHHMQISIAQELTGVPKFRKQYGYTAYSEGWGLYTEALSKEMGFQTDPYNDFGRLSGEIWRAIRLVVDTGIHAKRWSEKQAVDYFLANSAQPEAAIRSEVRRYIVTPGQATCYKIGMLRIQALRDEARKSLGARFDYRSFHDTVLGGGALPLPVLEARVRRWIAAQKA